MMRQSPFGGLGLDRFMARLLMVSFFLPMKAQGLAAMITGLYFVVRTFQRGEKVPQGNYLAGLVLSTPLLLYFVAIPFTPHEFLHTLSLATQEHASLLLMPLAFAIAAPSFGWLLREELIFFVYACFVTSLAANADFLYHAWIRRDIHGATHVQYRAMTHLFTDIHPTYMGMYQCFSICILLFTSWLRSGVGVWIRYCLLLPMVIFLLALGPKAPILALGVVFLHYCFVNWRKILRHKLFLVSIFAVMAASWLFIPFVRQRVAETVQGLESGESGAVANSVTMRKAIWDMDVSLLHQYWLTGIGPGRLKHIMREHYFFYSLINPSPIAYHDPHSEYVYQWLCFGIAGFVLFIVILLAHARKAFVNRDYIYLYLLIILYVTFGTETVLSMQRGVLFFAVFTSLFYFSKPLLPAKTKATYSF